MVRCNQCKRFFNVCNIVFKHREELRVIYDANFKADSMSRRVFIVRSHKLRRGYVHSWIKKELHAMSSQRNSLKRKTHPDAWQTTPKPVFQHNDTRADMNPVATYTQEHPHCHLGRHSPSMSPCITGGVTSPPMWSLPSEV